MIFLFAQFWKVDKEEIELEIITKFQYLEKPGTCVDNKTILNVLWWWWSASFL